MLENVLPDWLEKVEKIAEERGEINGEKRGEKRGEKNGDKRARDEIANNLLKIGLTIEQIIQATGLSHADILAIKTKNANA